jgi:hypothetical protein
MGDIEARRSLRVTRTVFVVSCALAEEIAVNVARQSQNQLEGNGAAFHGNEGPQQNLKALATETVEYRMMPSFRIRTATETHLFTEWLQ